MSDILSTLNRVRAVLERARLRSSLNGLDYNSLSVNSRVNRKVYAVDIARTPYIMSNNLDRIDVQRRMAKVNANRGAADYYVFKIKGRSTI